MHCSEVRALLVDLLYEEAGAEERSRLLAHLEECGECGERWSRLRALSAAADRWPAPPLPRGIAERALARVASERVRETRRKWPEFSPAQILPRVLLGAGAALVSLLLVLGTIEGQLAPLAIGAFGVVWTVLYAGFFLTASHGRLRPVAWSALTGAGIALILVPPLSIPTVVEWCARVIRAAPDSVSFALVLVLFAAGYTAGPLLVGGLAFGRPRSDHGLGDGATLAILYALLIAPAVYLQCLPLPLHVTAIWMVGGILGAALAGPLSLRLAEWRAAPV
ncbi:MAG: zf-HC2 domain-containing protein [Candidatus Rokubacteria bacterium]|nr:zf-HC2 domain-containing protein [Candidatus Rokubacteria bacterium]